MEKWKVLASKYLVQRPWATLRVDTLQMPNGNIKEEYYVLEYPNWVNMIGITEDNTIILIKQYRHGAEDILLELPAGVIEKGEDPADAARREMLEETGYAFSQIEKIAFYFYLALNHIFTPKNRIKNNHNTNPIISFSPLNLCTSQQAIDIKRIFRLIKAINIDDIIPFKINFMKPFSQTALWLKKKLNSHTFYKCNKL